jgi:hypothetical protein
VDDLPVRRVPPDQEDPCLSGVSHSKRILLLVAAAGQEDRNGRLLTKDLHLKIILTSA